MTPFRLQPISAHQTHALRHRVLRPHQPIAEMAYPGDDEPATVHLGAIAPDGAAVDAVVGIVSLYEEPMPDPPGRAAPGDWRLRGMAVEPGMQGSGVGSALVAAALEAVQNAGGRRVWCNARTPACGFYDRNGFHRLGDPFELSGIGEHYVMWIAVTADDR